MRILAALLIAAAALAGCGGGDEEQTTASSPCRHVSAQKAHRVSVPGPPKQTVKPGEKLAAVVKTSCGTFEIALATAQAPKTTNSFAYLARKKFYDGLSFQRIVPDYVIQGGDPLGNGTGGPGYSVDEAPPPNLSYTKGVVAMAKSAAEPPGRSGSQFFVVTKAAIPLDPSYALVGRVSKGIGVVDRIGRLGTPAELPKQPVRIDRITIRK